MDIKPIKIDALSFSYDKETVLNNISLGINQNDFVSIIGPNGSGKTTLLKHIARLIQPDRKKVWINNRDIRDYNQLELAKVMALVPQESHFEYGFSTFDVVMMGRHPHVKGFKGETLQDVKIVEHAMKQTDTFQFKDRQINSLSGGERQRVILARAIAQDASILLLDEPITYLDIHHQIDIISLIQSHCKEHNKTVVAVLHDLNFALKFSDSIILVHDGHILCVGKPEEVLTEENLKVAYGIDVELIRKKGVLSYIIPLY